MRNIIKDTDSHNAALLAKEAADSRARLNSLTATVPSREKPGAGADIRRRQLGDIAAILGGRSAKRKREERGRGKGSKGDTSGEDDARPEAKRTSRSRDYPGEALKAERQRTSRREESVRSTNYRSSRRSRDSDPSKDRAEDREKRRHRSRSRSRSPRERREKDRDTRIRHRSPRSKRSRSPETKRSREKSFRSHRHRRSPSTERRSARAEAKRDADYDSDPLDNIIGPRPPPVPVIKRKGRGTVSFASGIDSRFSANYDPAADVQLDFDEENDWDQALEALRDRTKWKQQGADRLRAAGFTEEEVSKWEKGGEKREEDVRWSKRGEGREWDRGKVVDESGVVSVKAGFGESTFGRLTGP